MTSRDSHVQLNPGGYDDDFDENDDDDVVLEDAYGGCSISAGLETPNP
jgi:hypothetical protein